MVKEFISDEGIILHKHIVKEKDLLFRILTRNHGLITAIGFSGARSKRRFGGKGEKFSHVRIFAKSYETYTSLEEISLINPHEELLLSLERIALMELVAEIILRTIPEGSDTNEIYNYLLTIMKNAIEEKNPLTLIPIILFNLLVLEGYTVPPEKCKSCNKPLTTTYFVISEGFLCPECSKRLNKSGIPFTEKEIEYLRSSLTKCEKIGELTAKIIKIWETILEKPLKSKKFIGEFIK